MRFIKEDIPKACIFRSERKAAKTLIHTAASNRLGR